jgi:hypothetical protein
MGLLNIFSTKDESKEIVNSTYFHEIQDAISLYGGYQDEILQRDINSVFMGSYDIFGERSAVMRHRMAINIIARIINKLAMVYSKAPTYTSPNTMDEIFKEFTPTFKTADRLSELCGMCWLNPYLKDGKFKLKAIPPHFIQPEYNEFNPDKLERLTVLSFTDTASQDRIIATVWTDETYHVYRGQEDVTDMVLASYGAEPNYNRENPYHIIPFIPFYAKRPIDGTNTANYREDLILAQRHLNVRLTDLFYLLHMQSFGQLVIKGMPTAAKKNFKIGMATPIMIDGNDPNSDAKFINPSAPIAEVWQVIQEILHFLAFTNGLSANWIGATVPSGEALKVVNSDLEEYRSDKQDEHKEAIMNLANLIEIIATVENIPNVTDEEFEIEFGSEEIYVDPIKEMQEWTGLIQNSVEKRIDWVKSRHPDLDDQAALQYINDAKEFEEVYNSTPVVETVPGSYTSETITSTDDTTQDQNTSK